MGTVNKERPYVLLVSLDGFRYDYPEKHNAHYIRSLGERGAASAGLTPEYPTTTFPNHYTMATGLRPAHHGIVDNNFYDPRRKASYNFKDRESAQDGTWYGGTPLWVLAAQQGVRSASYFWVGSEADVQHTHPTYYFPYDSCVSNETRIQQVLDWLRLPEPERPHFITLYFSDVDTAGHNFGPDTPQVRETVERLDGFLARLEHEISQTSLPVNVILVSDHGMVEIDPHPIDIDQYFDPSGFQVAWSGGQIMLYAENSDMVRRACAALRGKDARFDVYRREEIPEHLHYRDNPRIGDLVVIANGPYMLSTGETTSHMAVHGFPLGWHGYDVRRIPEMRGIFCAYGPNIQPSKTLPPFEGRHIYPFVARILGLEITEEIDGDPRVLESLYREA